MFQIDEKVLSDTRTLITVQGKKHQIDHLTKNGTINYVMEGNNLWLTTPKVRRSYVSKNDATESYDKLVIARDGINIDGLYEFDDSIVFKDNVEIKEDLVVRGNFTVEGNSTVIDTPSLSVEDNIIEINRNETGNGISLKRSGIAIDRGQKPFARTIYDEDQKGFVFDTSATMETSVGSTTWTAIAYMEKNGEYEPGEFRARHRLTAPNGKFTSNVSVGDKLVANNLTVLSLTDLKGFTTTSDTTVNGQLLVNNTATFNGLLTANSSSIFMDNVSMEKTLLVKETSIFKKMSTFDNGINVTLGGATVKGNTSLIGALTVTENAMFSKDVQVNANILCNNINTLFKSTTGDLKVLKNADITGNTNITGDLHVEGDVSLNQSVEINYGPLEVNALSEFNDDVSINNSNLNISSNGSNTGSLTVGGSANIQKSLDVDGEAYFDSNVTIKGNLSMEGSDIVSQNFTTKNDFKVEAGNGKGLKFWGSNNNAIFLADSVYGGKLDANSDFNMYFKMENGIDRGFVFRNTAGLLMQVVGTGTVIVKEKLIARGFDVLTRENEGHKSNDTGINADKLDSLHAADFLRRNVATDTTETIEFKTAGRAIRFNGGGSIYKNDAITFVTDNALTNGFKFKTESGTDLITIKDNAVDGIMYKTHTVWHKGNQGHNTGMDADTVDGRHASYFSPSTHLHDDRYIRNDEVNLKGKYKIEYNETFDSLDFMYMGNTP